MSKTSSFVASSTCKQSPSPPRRTLPRSRSQTLLNHGGTTGWPKSQPLFFSQKKLYILYSFKKVNVSIFLNRIQHALFFFKFFSLPNLQYMEAFVKQKFKRTDQKPNFGGGEIVAEIRAKKYPNVQSKPEPNGHFTRKAFLISK